MKKCANRTYDPKHFGAVMTMLLDDDWQSQIEGFYKPEDAKALIQAIKEGTFNRDYGRTNIRGILAKRDPLTNAKEVSHLKANYIQMRTGKNGGDFDKMKTRFLRNLIERVLLDKNLQRIEVDKVIDGRGTTLLNKNLYDYKIELIKRLREVLFPSQKFEYKYDGKNSFSKLIAETISEYESRRLTNNALDKLWDTYFMLKHFDQLLSDFDSFIDIKPEFKNNALQSMDMYMSVKPYVRYDTSFNPNEFASAEQYASEVLKTLLDFFKEYDAEKELDEVIGFKGFNYSVTRLIEWVEQQPNPALKDELTKGNDINWSSLIEYYIAANANNLEVVKKLRGLKHIFDTATLDDTLREMLNEQKERVVRYQFESYRMMYDPGLRRNVLVPLRVEDGITDRQKGVIAKQIRTKVNYFRKNPSEYADFLETHDITYDGTSMTFTIKGLLKGGGAVKISIEPHPDKTYIFKLKDANSGVNRVGSELDNEAVRSLVNDLFNFYISDSYTTIFDTPGFNGRTMWDTWGESIMRTLAASLTGENNLNYTYRKNGTELEFKGTSYSDLSIPAAFLSIMNGFSKITVAKNGLGNDLPIYQQVSAIHRSHQILRNALSNYENIRSGNHNGIKGRVTIYDYNILKANRFGNSPIGGIFVKSDFDYDGTNKTSAQMNFRELTHLAVLKSFYHNLHHNDGNITLQTTCLSDKHTHFMVQFLTKNILIQNDRLSGEKNLREILINAASLNPDVRKFYTQIMLDEIKFRRDKKTRAQIVNIYNRYALIEELGLVADADVNMSFDELKARVDALNTALNKFSKKEQVYALCANANSFNGIDFKPEADLITLGDKVYLNETLYHNFLDYCDPNDANFKERIEQQMLLHAKFMFDNHFVLDGYLDPDVLRIINTFKKADSAGNINSEAFKWFDDASKVMKPFRLFNKQTGEEIIPNYIGETYEAQFDPDLVRVELNPVLNSHYLADVLLSNSFNEIIFGEDWGIDGKAINDINDEYEKAIKQKLDVERKLEQLKKDYVNSQDYQERFKIQGSINILQDNLNKVNASLDKLDYNSKAFRYRMEASRLNMHYKRTVHGGATYTPLLQNLKWGVAPKVKVAVYKDTKDPVFSLTGDVDKFTSQDGAGWTSPYFSRMANRSFVDGAVGKNKKTIFSYVDPETGILTLIKWAEYEITNAVRRDSPIDSEHASSELMFKKAHSFDITNAVDWDNFDISKYYNRKGGIRGITRTKSIYKKDINTGKHYLLHSIKNEGQSFTAIWQEVDEKGNPIYGKTPTPDRAVYVDNLYKLDQVLGGQYTEEVNENGWLDWSEAQNDIVYTIICDNDLKDYFIGFTVNASAVKSGMTNVNPIDSFFGNNTSSLLWYEISTRIGGAQMNADHILNEAEVTEMSQMISALIQAGLKTNSVDKVYRFIGQVAAESLGQLTNWINNEDNVLDVYKWLGESIARSLNAGQSDTLGLAGAFIGRANKNFRDNGLKTKIPFSANTVKGIFESSITSFINSKSIHRKFPGGGFVQNPTFDVKPRYNFGGMSYSYTEFADELRKKYGGKYTVDQVLTDRSCFRDPTTGRIVFYNPFIHELSRAEISELDIDDTVIVWTDEDMADQTKKLEDRMQVVRLKEFVDYDKYRNSPEYHVAKWDVRPKNLLGSRTFFYVNGVKHSLYDLDSTRASIYASLALDPKSVCSAKGLLFLQDYLEEHQEILEGLENEKDKTINNKKVLENLKKYAVWQTKQDLRELSKIQASGKGTFKNQKTFSDESGEVDVTNVYTDPSEILIGVADAKAFGIEKTSDLQEIETRKEEFFLSRMQKLTQKPPTSSVDRSVYDIIAHGSDGSTTLVIVNELHDKQPNLTGMSANYDYTISVDGVIYHNGEDLGSSNGKQFFKYIGQDGTEYDVLYCDTLADFENFNRENQLYSNTIDNYTEDNVRFFSKLRNKRFAAFGDLADQAIVLNRQEQKEQDRRLLTLARQKYASWQAYKKGIATRIPAQSMQSFTAVKVVGFTNDTITNAYVSTMLTFLQGSDFDIDKLYIMRYGFTDDGRLATFSNLDQEFDPEKCLDLPIPKGRTFKVTFGDKLTTNIFRSPDEEYHYIDTGKGGLDLIREILETTPDDTTKPINVVVDISRIYAEQGAYFGFDKDLLNTDNLRNNPQGVVEDNLERWLNKHESTKRSGSTKQLALKNVVVRGILDVITDASTQFNLQIPIEMKEQRRAARTSNMSSTESILTGDNPSAKTMMTIQNMVGREVIGIGAASLKAFFAASTYFNTNVEYLARLLNEYAESYDNDYDLNSNIFNVIKQLVFNGKFQKQDLITLANINYQPALNALQDIETIILTKSDYDSLEPGINDKLKKYIDVNNGQYILRINDLLHDLDLASNGDWRSPIDAAYSLSGLISAATDNAKELILAKINATSKFADIYTYLLSIGETFDVIAKFMMSPEFKIVSDFADGNMMDSDTRWFNLENSLKFVLDEETLPNMNNRVFEGLLTNWNDSFTFLKTIAENNFDKFKVMVGKNNPILSAIPDLDSFIKRIIEQQKRVGEGEYDEEYKDLVAFAYNILRNDLSSDELLLKLLRNKVNETVEVRGKEDFNPDLAFYDDAWDEDYYSDAQEDVNFKPKAYYFNPNTLKHDDWVNLYRYVSIYLLPKNQKLQGIRSLGNLIKLRDNIIPALKEQRILSRILGVNQGLNTKDFEEYKWIRDIEAFVNERFVNGSSPAGEFNLMWFLDPTKTEYKQQMIDAYEKVKSTYNILSIIDSAKHFKSMLERARDNRILIEKAYILKVERKLADAILRYNKTITNGLSLGLTQKLREKEFGVLRTFAQDLITANWLNTLSDVAINIPYIRKSPLKFFKGGSEMIFNPGDIFEGMDKTDLLEYTSKLNIEINDDMSTEDIRNLIRDRLDADGVNYANETETVHLNSLDGMATFKWMMEHYIIPKLKQVAIYKNNSFIQSLQLSSRYDEVHGKEVEFYTLPIDLTNATNNSSVEETFNAYSADFNHIWNDFVPGELGIVTGETNDWTIGDLFYLYNLYVNKDGFGRNSLTRIFDNVVLSDDDNTLLYRYYDYVCQLDSELNTIEELENINSNMADGSSGSVLTEVRIALANQNGAKSRFRSEIVEDRGVSYFVLYDAKYNEQQRYPINNLDNNYFLFPFYAKYNPIKIVDTSEHAREVNKRNLRKFKIGGREAIETIIKAFQDTFGDVVPIVTIDGSWFTREGKNIPNVNLTRTARGFIYNGKIYINTDNANLGTPIHELMHVLFAAMKYGTPEQRQLYYNLLRSTKAFYEGLDGPWHKFAQEIADRYNYNTTEEEEDSPVTYRRTLVVGSDLEEEIMVHIFGDLFGSGYISAMGAMTKDDEIEVTYKDLQKQIFKAIETVFKIKLPEMRTSKLNQSVMNMTLSQLLVDFSSSLFNFNTNLLVRTYIPMNQKIAKFKAMAVSNSDNDSDDLPKLIISGDC